MKHFYRFLFTLLVVLSYSNSIQAQIENYYTFSEGTASYEPLIGATERVLRQNTFGNMAIPFEFEYAGMDVTYIWFNNYGIVYFGGTSVPNPNNLSDVGQQTENGSTGIIAPFWDNNLTVVENNTVAKRKTLVSGTAPNRILTIEFEKLLWTENIFNPNISSEVSFRVVLEETTNNISFVYGPNNSVDGPSASIGLNTEFADQISFLSVTPGMPSTVSNTTSNDNITPTEYPGEGVSYTFTYVAPDCGIPSDLVIDNNSLTPNSVDVNWINSGTETEWEILLINLTTSTRETIITNSNPYTLTNLEEDTSYSISIKSKCTGIDGNYSSQKFFRTPARCPTPLSLSNPNIAIDSADFTWQAGASETSWEAIVVPSTDPEPTNGNIISSTSYNATGLLKDTDYTFYVRSNCETEGFSKWKTINFRTLATCFAPTSVTAIAETCTSGTVSWNSNGSENQWEILLVSFYTGEETIVQANSNPYTIEGLLANHNYRVYVKAICASDDESRYSTQYVNLNTRVEDTTHPVAVSKDITIELVFGAITISPQDIDDGSTDNCNISNMYVSPKFLNCTNLGDNIVTLYVTDSAGNTSSSTSTVTIVDNTSPIVRTKDFTLELLGSGTNALNARDINDNSYDNCENPTYTLSQQYFDCSDIGTTVVTLTATDSSGNSDSATANVTIVDRVVPNVYCVAPFTLQLDETGNATITAQDIDNNSFDNCAIESIEIDKTNFTTSDIGEHVVTLTITDPSGNVNLCTTTVTVEGETFTIEDYVTGLVTPRGLAFDKDQILYIAEYNTGKIYKATDIETKTEYASSGFNNNGIAFDEAGILYVAENFLSRILSFNTNGQESTYLSSSDGINSPWDLEYDYSGNLYISNFSSGSILKVTPEGDITTHASGLFSPEGMSFDSSGNLYVADRNDAKLQKIAPNGSVTTVLSGSNYIGIRAVAVDGADFVYLHQQVGFGSSATEKIIKYNPNDGAVIDIVGGLDDVNYLKFNNAGDLFISQDDRVSVIRGVGEPNTLSVGEVVLDKTAIQFYPNPVKDRIIFTKSPSEIIIYDISGKAVFESKNSLNEYDLSELINGIYFVKVINHIGDSAVIKISKV